MEREFFGTDGIRGTANSWPMTAEIAVRAGMAAGLQFIRGDHRHRVVVGKDTRLSGYMLEPALTAGFTSVGMDVILVGPMPTPAVAMLTRSLRADLGVVLSASHNHFADNGIKLFGPDGYKLSDRIETEIAARMQSDISALLAKPADLGRAMRLEDAPGRYIEAAKATFPTSYRLNGLKIVIDCANGAAYKVAPTVLWELEAEVIPIAVNPDGFNINKDCGSVHTDYMCEQVVAHGADIGIALDGDADRLIVADENGRIVDGDQLMAAISDAWAESGNLRGGGIVATVMSNLGLERHLSAKGLAMVRTQVGDRYVVEHMRRHGFNLGGEQSGHIVMSDFSTTGDGLIAALQILALVVAEKRPVSEVCRRFEAVPQLLKNVRYNGVSPLDTPQINDAIQHQRSRLGNEGRLLIRPSGTEPLIRIMAEGDDRDLMHSVVDELIDLIETAAAAT
ncbi:MAG: phosphoglucosamine mutase [Proteobacteria bacterium]|nr:phosphoglucosamine mutase [Pseudomonadota bacterium]